MGHRYLLLEERAAAARDTFREVADEIRRTREQMAALRAAMHRQRGMLFPLLLERHLLSVDADRVQPDDPRVTKRKSRSG